MKNVFIVDGDTVRTAGAYNEETQQVVMSNMPERIPVTDENRFKRQVLKYSEAEGVHFVIEETTNAERRKTAYATLREIEFENRKISVDEANTLWFAYAAEKNAKADELSALITAEKAKIRAQYPDAE